MPSKSTFRISPFNEVSALLTTDPIIFEAPEQAWKSSRTYTLQRTYEIQSMLAFPMYL